MIPGIVHLTSKTLYGMTSRNAPLYRFRPLDDSLPDMIVGSSHSDRTRNILALVDVAADYTTPPRGTLVRVLGLCGDPAAEQEALLWRWGPPLRWNKHTLQPIVHPSFAHRRLLDVPTVNIDPPGCRDIDDCVSIWKEKDTLQLAITIADVHEWVTANPWLTRHAPRIGQTYYTEEGKVVVPMLPPELSEKHCSLLPGVKRLGVSLIYTVTPDFQLVNPHIEKVVITNKASHTYESIYSATDFPVYILERVTGKTDSHEWVSELMIRYNKYAAEKAGMIYRAHFAPDAEKLDRYMQLDPALNLLAFSAATYTTAPTPHWGLGGLYCHATSPIRRWADVLNQGALKEERCISYNVELMNETAKNAKRYSRDMFFLNQVLIAEPSTQKGIVVDSNLERARVYVYDWKRVVTVKNCTQTPGTLVTIDYFVDMNAHSMKKRILFRCVGTDYPGQPHPAQSADAHHADVPAA
jgi:exoribonuclease R